MIERLLKERKLPDFKDKNEMIEIMLKEVYGYLPEKPESISFSAERYEKAYCAGNATLDTVTITTKVNGKEFSFPMYASIPTNKDNIPFFVMVNFRDNVPDLYMPVEEIIDSGYAVLSFCYNDVTSDDNDFTNGLAGVLYENGERKSDTDPGKIAMWAWAAQRVMDYAETVDCLDKSRATVCGHSRLGKTALLAGATDERFFAAYSNNSGCSGAAITRDKEGERVKEITTTFPFWFCKNYCKYSEKEYEMPFDQHYLVASIFPRRVYITSATKDIWACPISEFLTAVKVSEYYEKNGLPALKHKDRFPEAGEIYHDGYVGYHLREGLHYMGRYDWQKAIEYLNKQ